MKGFCSAATLAVHAHGVDEENAKVSHEALGRLLSNVHERVATLGAQ